VPVEAPSNWLIEKPAAPEPAPGPPRFKSEDDDEEAESAESDGAFFFSSSRPAVATTVTLSASSTAAVENDSEFERQQFERIQEERTASARPQFDEKAEESAVPPQQRDYAADFTDGVSVQAIEEEQGAQPVTSLFAEGNEAEQRDLDVPAFLRRLQF
jgi:hypothetical protein